MTTDVPLVVIEDLEIRFAAGVPTLDRTDLAIRRGEIVALVGESGSGKSLLASAIAGILPPTARAAARRFDIAGRDVRSPDSPAWQDLRGAEIGFVFQNPRAALSPVRRIGDQIADVLAAHLGLRGAPLRAAVIDALADVRIPDPERRARAYSGELSGGMCQRVMIALALAGRPALMIADEPTTGLDSTTQATILDLIRAQAVGRHMSCLLITHDLALARRYAERVIVMHAGQIVEQGPTDRVYASPRHPYTAALLRATPATARTVDDLQGVAGTFPNLSRPVPACRFAERCSRAMAICSTERPLLKGEDGHLAACWSPGT